MVLRRRRLRGCNSPVNEHSNTRLPSIPHPRHGLVGVARFMLLRATMLAVQAAALEMRTRLDGLNTHRARQGKSPLRHGIGIHSGTVLAGVIGSASRLFYALVGDAVNVASRIQELSKTVQTDIVVSASTRRRLQRRYDLAEIGTTTLRGRAEGVAWVGSGYET